MFYLENKGKIDPFEVATTYMYINDSMKNYKKAEQYLQISAERGNTEALYVLGNLYYTGGFGLEEDNKKARKYYAEAARKGELLALHALRTKKFYD